MSYSQKYLLKKEIELIIEENNHTADWIKNCVGDDKDVILSRFINKFYRALRFELEYNAEEECFNLIDDGVLDAHYCQLHCDLMYFMKDLHNAVKKQLKEDEERKSKIETFKAMCECERFHRDCKEAK